jgi:hypothetical protein
MDGKYILIQDITINEPWTPIGEAGGDFFSGTLNGRNGIIVVNTIPGGTREYCGIFSRIKDGVIENLKLYVNNIEVSLQAQANQTIGVLTGTLEGSALVNNVELAGEQMTILRSGMSEAFIGGIAGCIKDQAEIKNSRSQTEIIADVKTPALMTYTGGITGYIDNEAVVRQTINKSSIKVTSETGSAAVGGIAGGIAVTAQYNNPQIYNSYSTGNISCSAGVQAVAGGIAAMGNGFVHIAFCYTAGNVLAVTQSGNIYCAGIVGYPREKDTARPAAAQNKINSCAVFAQTISASSDENTFATHSVNRIAETECTDCAISGSAAGACPRPSTVGVSAMCGCAKDPSTPGIPSREDFLLPGNVVETKTKLLLNGRPISVSGETCHCGRPVSEIQQSQLQNWDCSAIWFWPIGAKFPDLLQKDNT